MSLVFRLYPEPIAKSALDTSVCFLVRSGAAKHSVRVRWVPNGKDTEFAWLVIVGVDEGGGVPFPASALSRTISARLYANSATSCSSAVRADP